MIRPLHQLDVVRVREMMHALWPHSDPPREFEGQIFVYEENNKNLGGFIWVAVRPWVDGSDQSPCPHIEGWYVEPELRHKGIGRELVAAVEHWAKAQGFRELTSDVEMENEMSLSAHAALGFEPTSKIQYFKKKL